MPTNEQYEDFISHLPVTASDRTLMALKGHLLVEQALRKFIESRVPQPSRIKDKQIQFAVLVDFASCLAKDGEIDWIWGALKTLNQFRNTLAHKLSPQKTEEIENKFITHVKNHDGELSVFIGRSKLKYGEFPLAVFQVYDILLSAAHMHDTEKTLTKACVRTNFTPPEGYTDDRVRVAITKAFLAVEGGYSSGVLHGPRPKNKWPKLK
ncbi:hypothetical protein PS710_01732 [Pseudomonas fluorescens]|uniref:Uncharacterized protein n=1 Tax=Pseudomonas fluorescens TaxID=294 RepID=A0A5E7BXG9_PSEFL|nr:hypothetical protein PS710_01732 [Pseudomonas fluorescens]